MRKHLVMTLTLLLGGSLVIGCKGEDETPVAPPPPEPQAQTQGARAEQQARDVLNQAGQRAREGVDNAGAAVEEAAGSLTGEQAQRLLDQAKTYISENKLDLAEQTVSRLEANRESLPQAVQDQLPNVRKMLDEAKSRSETPTPAAGN
jgi:hypothetical protein